ncbi:uncharacterized protein LOC128246515 [Mya arenaria]|nr:uncharacterized protein LOC128246515 [Mya arenaria]
MNYLETGLPHTALYQRKTQFSPPRFIPLCTLGRTYMGLEPLSKHELNELSKRLSEPKKALEREENVAATEVRPKSTGTGRFVGHKKMNNLQIEKMVDRLYSRRHTKNYEFVDDDVAADDILNMTDRHDESSDSEAETGESKEMKDRKNVFLRRHSAMFSNHRSKTDHMLSGGKFREHIHHDTKMESPTRQDEDDDVFCEDQSPSVPKLKTDVKPRLSASFHRENFVAENRRNVIINRNHLVKRHNSEYTGSPRPILQRSATMQGPSCPMYAIRKQVVSNGQAPANTIPSLRPKSEPTYPTRSDITEVKILKLDSTKSTQPTQRTSYSKPDVKRSVSFLTPRSAWAESSRSVGTTRKEISPVSSGEEEESATTPHQKLPRLEERSTKSPRYATEHCDELLIDRVATYNRTPRLRTT